VCGADPRSINGQPGRGSRPRDEVCIVLQKINKSLAGGGLGEVFARIRLDVKYGVRQVAAHRSRTCGRGALRENRGREQEDCQEHSHVFALHDSSGLHRE
jgi:hypothetical protein